MQEFAVPVNEPGSFCFVVVALFLNPETPFQVVIDIDRVGPAGRTSFGGLTTASDLSRVGLRRDFDLYDGIS